MSVLLLGGTAEARALAARLHAGGVPVVSSLAGDVADLRLPEGEVRLGGFGGVDGLAAYLHTHEVAAVVDATHPFAATITAHAATACTRVGVPLLRLSRPSWVTRGDAASWHWVDSIAAAREQAGQMGSRVFLAIGRQSLAEFTDWDDRFVLVRVVDLPGIRVPDGWRIVRARGPFRLVDELDLLRRHGVDVLVTKDSGGSADAKLDAAAQLGVPVVVVRRPGTPHGVAVVSSPAAALAWLQERGLPAEGSAAP